MRGITQNIQLHEHACDDRCEHVLALYSQYTLLFTVDKLQHIDVQTVYFTVRYIGTVVSTQNTHIKITQCTRRSQFSFVNMVHGWGSQFTVGTDVLNCAIADTDTVADRVITVQ